MCSLVWFYNKDQRLEWPQIDQVTLSALLMRGHLHWVIPQGQDGGLLKSRPPKRAPGGSDTLKVPHLSFRKSALSKQRRTCCMYGLSYHWNGMTQVAKPIRGCSCLDGDAWRTRILVAAFQKTFGDCFLWLWFFRLIWSDLFSHTNATFRGGLNRAQCETIQHTFKNNSESIVF